jgi:hypothetical protein
MTVDAFPLCWPHHVPRTPASKRIEGTFMVTPGKAMEELLKEVRLSGGTGLVLSTNVPLRRDGLPYANSRDPEDPGVAVYFTRKGQQVCVPCDSYDRVWKNIRAIGLSIKDMRGPEMRGCAAITDAAYTGFLALPAPTGRPWWVVLGVSVSASVEEISEAHKGLVRLMVLTGSVGDREDELAALNIARDEGLAIRRAETAAK